MLKTRIKSCQNRVVRDGEADEECIGHLPVTLAAAEDLRERIGCGWGAVEIVVIGSREVAGEKPPSFQRGLRMGLLGRQRSTEVCRSSRHDLWRKLCGSIRVDEEPSDRSAGLCGDLYHRRRNGGVSRRAFLRSLSASDGWRCGCPQQRPGIYPSHGGRCCGAGHHGRRMAGRVGRGALSGWGYPLLLGS